jgi:hypothetical protein
MTIRFPPPAATFLDPDPLAADVRPIPTIDRRRRQQEGVFFVVQRHALADDKARIGDRFRHRQDFEIAQGKIAQRVEIVHLAAHEKERVLHVLSGGRGSDDHPGRVVPGAGDAVGRAHGSAEGSQVSQAVTQLRFGACEREKQESERCQAEDVFGFHRVKRRPSPSVLLIVVHAGKAKELSCLRPAKVGNSKHEVRNSKQI